MVESLKKGSRMEPRVPAVLPKRELYFVLSALMLGMLLAALDATIVSTALPTIVGDLHGANHLSWVVVGVSAGLHGQYPTVGQTR